MYAKHLDFHRPVADRPIISGSVSQEPWDIASNKELCCTASNGVSDKKRTLPDALSNRVQAWARTTSAGTASTTRQSRPRGPPGHHRHMSPVLTAD